MKINSHYVFLFLPMNHEPTIPVINLATFFQELSDVVDVRLSQITRAAVLALSQAKSDIT
jgi:hypothetical protein